jgi:hypothetical protein
MDKIIQTKEGNFYIRYWSNNVEIERIIDEKYIDPINILFVPISIIMTENQCLEYTGTFISQLNNEVTNIISDNAEFYRHFQINLPTKFTGFSLRISKTSCNYYVITSNCNINCRFLAKDRSATINLGCKQ